MPTLLIAAILFSLGLPAWPSAAAEAAPAPAAASPNDAAPPPAGSAPAPAAQPTTAILGQPVDDATGKAIGRVVDVLVTASGAPSAAVIDFGGFLGVGSRRIAVDWTALRFAPGGDKHPITLLLTLDQIKAAPDYIDTAKPAPVAPPPPDAAAHPAESTAVH